MALAILTFLAKNAQYQIGGIFSKKKESDFFQRTFNSLHRFNDSSL